MDTACKNSQGSVGAIQENSEKCWLNEKYTLNLKETGPEEAPPEPPFL